jgi:hypothetical protein
LTGDAATDAMRPMWEGGPLAGIPDSPRIALVVSPGAEPGGPLPGKPMAKIKAAMSARHVPADAKAKVVVKVSGINKTKLVGKLKVDWGKGSKTVNLRRADKGKRTVVLPKLPKGLYRVKVIYRDPVGDYMDTWADTIRFRVVKR